MYWRRGRRAEPLHARVGTQDRPFKTHTEIHFSGTNGIYVALSQALLTALSVRVSITCSTFFKDSRFSFHRGYILEPSDLFCSPWIYLLTMQVTHRVDGINIERETSYSP